MNKLTISAASGILLCAGSVLGQINSSASQPVRRRIIIGTPEQQGAIKTRYEQCNALDMAGFTALNEGRYTEAETDARQSLAISHDTDLLAPELLAASLDAQGKTRDALAAYRILADQGTYHPRDLLPYSLLLLKAGQWTEAVAAYNKCLPYIGFGQLLRKTSNFTTTDPEPTVLATAIHVGLGLTYLSSADWAGNSRHDSGLAHFQQALALAPNSSLANYYYGYGLRRLGRRAEAQAAFRKAAALDNGSIREAAQKELPSAGASR